MSQVHVPLFSGALHGSVAATLSHVALLHCSTKFFGAINLVLFLICLLAQRHLNDTTTPENGYPAEEGA